MGRVLRLLTLINTLAFIKLQLVHSARPVIPNAASVFRENADELKMYAAVLAATEPLRLQRDEVHSLLFHTLN